MKIHQLNVKEAFESLQTGPQGLSVEEAYRRGDEYGPNEVERVRHGSLTARFIKCFSHFFAIVLWIAALLAFIAEARQPAQGMATLGFAIMGVILVNGCFSFWQEYRAEKAVTALQKLLPHRVSVKRAGNRMEIGAEELVPGDLIFLRAGDQVPADSRVISSTGLRVNNATVTGESMPHSRNEAASSEADLIKSANTLLAGTSVVSGEATALVFATGSHTVFGQIARLTQSIKETLSPLQQEITALSRWVALLALTLGLLFFLIAHSMGLPFWANLTFAIGIIVANVPEGLLPTVTLALAMGAQRMAKRFALVRHLPSVETLGATSVICTDKTGTLTENRLSVTQLFVAGQLYTTSDHVRIAKLASSHPLLFAIALGCQNVKEIVTDGHRTVAGDPLEVALMEFGKTAPLAAPLPPIFEVPFDSSRRRMSVICPSHRGSLLLLKGAPEVVLGSCSQVEMSAGAVPFTFELQQQFGAAQQRMADVGLRVLAMAYRHLSPSEIPPKDRDISADAVTRLESQLTLCAFAGLEDPPRPEVPEALRKCRDAGIKVIMVTGDHPHTAAAIAREIGLIKSSAPSIITGDQLDRLSNTQLQLALDAPEILFARTAADQKARVVAALRRKKQIVAVTGDGVNDAPALRKADIGIAMGRAGTEVARESADIILLDDNFATIVAAVEEGRAVYANIRKFLTYILTSNIPELVPYLASVLCRIPLPLTIIQILAVDLGTDMVPALALGAEPPDPCTMQQPPRPRAERLLTWGLVVRAYLWLGLLQAVAAMAAFFYVLNRGGWAYGDILEAGNGLYLQATTACLSAIVVMQVANLFICRSRRESVFRSGLFTNPLIWLGIAVECTLILLIDYTPWGNAVFGTAPLPLSVWLFVLPFAFGMLLFEEVRKRLAYTMKRTVN